MGVCTPLWTRWSAQGAWLVRLRVYILGQWRTGLVGKSVCRLTLEQCQAGFNVDVRRVEFSGARVGIKRITCLVVARLILSFISKVASFGVVVGMLTNVPKSYQTSEMFGLRRMARE